MYNVCVFIYMVKPDKPENLNSFPRTHMVKGDYELSLLSSDLLACPMARMIPYLHLKSCISLFL